MKLEEDSGQVKEWALAPEEDTSGGSRPQALTSSVDMQQAQNRIKHCTNPQISVYHCAGGIPDLRNNATYDQFMNSRTISQHLCYFCICARV